MSEEIKTPEVPNENLPAFVKAAPELLPVWDWWVKEGKSTLAMLLVVAIAVMGFYTWKNYQKRNAAAANQVLMNAISTEDLESAVSDYGSTKVGPALRLRLAKRVVFLFAIHSVFLLATFYFRLLADFQFLTGAYIIG